MSLHRKDRIHQLLKGIETGDPASVSVVNQEKYIQHNPQTHEGSEGLESLFKRLSKSSPRVNIVRTFEDGDYVFAHTEYDFATRNIGFEVFRFEDEQAVEHWDNIQLRQGPSPSGHSMVDGPTEVTDKSRTEMNRKFVRSFVENTLIKKQYDLLEQYINPQNFTQHNSQIADGVTELYSALSEKSDQGFMIQYHKIHRLLAEGNFVLAVSEGFYRGEHCAFYDLFRVARSKLVEHWDTIEAIPPQSEWKNDNGKF